jgi:hypothetical protein
VKNTVVAVSVAFQQVPPDTVLMVTAFLSGPMKRLSGVVLVVSDLGYERHVSNCIREVVENACDNGQTLTSLRTLR